MGKRFNKIKNCFRRLSKKSKSSAKKEPCFDYQALPTDIKRCIIDFLPTDDIISLTKTSKGITNELDLSVSTYPVIKGSCNQNISVVTFSRRRNPMRKIAAIVPTETDRIQSISFQCDWVDQGMGKLKGKLYVIAQNKSLLHQSGVPFHKGRVVCEPITTDHMMSKVSLTFHSKPAEFYQIWCFVGDSYGYMLHFKNMRFNILRYGQNQKIPFSIIKYRFSYEEDDATHMRRMSDRWMDYMFFNGEAKYYRSQRMLDFLDEN